MQLKTLFANNWKLLIYLLLIISALHLVRDIMQIYRVNNFFSAPLNTDKTWCNPYCDYVTLPPEIFIIIGSVIILVRKRFGLLGKVSVVVFLVWLVAFLCSLITGNQGT